MRKLFLISISVGGLLNIYNLSAQSSESFVPTAPTSFQDQLLPENETEFSKILRDSPSVRVNENGGFGHFSTFSIRGSDSKDIGVGLEGIRFNSPAQGAFDLSSLSLFGISDIQVVRGAYSPFSTNPAGFVNLRLPNPQRPEAKISYGSFDYYSLGVLTPKASFSFERSENDFLFKTGNAYLRRFQNRAHKMNLLAWHRTENHQVWGMLNLVSQELPPPANDLDAQYDDYYQGVMPIIAYQGQNDSWQWASWAKFEEQEVSSPARTQNNRLWYSGASLQKSHSPTSQISLQHGVEVTQDYLFHADFDAKNRQNVSIHSSAYFSPSPAHFIHPRLRVEFVSDLEQPLSAHPGIGGRHQIAQGLTALWNFSYVSRAPTFGELYYEMGTFLPNPDLNREQSLHGDVGYQLKISKMEWQQALFGSRTFDTIVLTETATGEFQSVNSGTEVAWGLEQQLRYYFGNIFHTSASYTYLQALLHEVQKPYQPRHQLSLKPSLTPTDSIQISLPIYARSSVRIAENSNDKIPEQWNLGAEILTSWERWQASIAAYNLLRWKLEEVANYPSPHETFYKLSLNYRF